MNSRRLLLTLGFLVVILGGLGWLMQSSNRHIGHAHESGDDSHQPRRGKSITDTGIEWPSREKIRRTLTLADYNTRVVFAGVTALGAAGGLVGTFLLLRKRSLLSDTVSHSSLSGFEIEFLVKEGIGNQPIDRRARPVYGPPSDGRRRAWFVSSARAGPHGIR